MNVTGIDIGTTKVKVVKRNNGIYAFNQFLKTDWLENLSETNLGKDSIIITGSGAKTISHLPNTVSFNELECTANLVKHLNYSKGLVINIGTGTSFVSYDNQKFEHITGTGIGGGTFRGLCKRLLNTTDLEKITQLSFKGDVKNINLVIDDIYEEKLSWLSGDATVSNFAKNGQAPEDIAVAIHSITIEPIISILKAIVSFHKPENIIFSGGVVNNKFIQKQIDAYCKAFGIEYQLLGKPSFGTCLGAITLFDAKN